MIQVIRFCYLWGVNMVDVKRGFNKFLGKLYDLLISNKVIDYEIKPKDLKEKAYYNL